MNDNIKNWSIHVEFVIIFITLLGGYFMIDSKIERQGERTDKLYQIYCETNEKFNQKFYDLKVESDKRFYEMLKETK